MVQLVQNNDHMGIKGHVVRMMSTLTMMRSLMQQQINMSWNARLFTWWKCVGAHKLLYFIMGEGSRNLSCLELLQMEHICNKLSRMCFSHIIATKIYDIKIFILHGLIMTVFLYMLYMQIYLYLFSPFCTCCHKMFCICVRVWKIIHVPCMKSSLSTLQCCTFVIP